MLTKLWNFFHACEHNWKVIGSNDIKQGGLVVGQEYQEQCTKCGKLQRKKSITVSA